jgi:hypothetical protein
MKRSRLQEFFLLTGLLALALLPRLYLLQERSFRIFSADQAVVGLMGKHILDGHPMVYFYGQAYMGSLEAFMAALIYLVRGIDIISVQLAPLVFFLLFLVVNFYLLKRLFGLEVSLAANVLLAISPPELTRLSVVALGGYPETLFFGSLTLFGLTSALKLKRRGWVFLFTGLAAGIGFWVNNLIVMYFFAITIFWLLGTRSWRKAYPSLGWRQIFLLEGIKMPAFLRLAVFVIHVGVSLFILWQLVSFFTGETVSLGGLEIKMASPPFHMKRMKRLFLVLSVETVGLTFFLQGAKKFWKGLRPALPLVGGFVLGASPVFLYALLGGEGYRLIHGSGMIYARNVPVQFQSVILEGFLYGICGIRFDTLWAWGILALWLLLFLYYGFLYRKELGELIRLRPARTPQTVFPFLLTVIVLLICFFNSLQSGRYLFPAYFSVSLILALALTQLRLRIGIVSWIVLFVLLTHNAYANFYWIRNLPTLGEIEQGYDAILHELERREIRGGYTHFVSSYTLTFLAKEKVIVAPYRSPDRYPAYTKYVDGLPRVAYIFRESDSYHETFEKKLRKGKIRFEKQTVGPFQMFLIDRAKKSEKGVVE